jgi:hypothetical protein
VVVPSGDVVVVVLSTGAPAGAIGVLVAKLNASPIRRSLFLSHLLSIFIELLHVCLHRNEVRFCLLHCCDVKVLICGDDECVNI